jgi:hypothetical protein
MTEWLSRVGDLFVAPAVERPALPRAAALGGAPSAVVLGGGGIARLLAGALRGHGAGCALLAAWSGVERPEPPGGPSSGPARAAAARLTARGLRATARGRLVALTLPEDAEAALAAWRRATGASGCPAVLSIEEGRPAALEPALVDADLIVVVLPPEAGEDGLEGLALAGLAGLRAPVAVTRPLPPGAARLAGLSSLATARALGADVLSAVRVVA